MSIWDLQDTYHIKVLSAKNANAPEHLKVIASLLAAALQCIML